MIKQENKMYFREFSSYYCRDSLGYKKITLFTFTREIKVIKNFNPQESGILHWPFKKINENAEGAFSTISIKPINL